ncbi:MAG: NAD(P)/FAD-dependent oxidoreductase [Candidatus Omnitrophica bacterium]|nr:NAD(P)/FAD-dependent oxidoreductase [Candidatus Omnitrophota bacterium]
MEKVDIIIIGAGVVGLSIAARISKPKYSVYVLEKHSSFGQEASSRNSEVIHAGIYYESGSLKAKTCVEGNKMLYEICEKNGIAFRQTGKLIVATEDDEENSLMNLFNKGQNNGVIDLKIISQEEIIKMEHTIKAKAALLSPSTGIVDTHSLMEYLIQCLKEKGGDVAYNSHVTNISRTLQGYEVTIKDNIGDDFKIQAQIVINSAGLNSDRIAEMVGIDIKKQDYELKYCKGQYFRITDTQKCKLINRLIYPVPKMESGGLGIHATLDLGNSIRLGPDSHYIERDKIDYSVDVSEKRNFLNSAINFLPFLEEEDLSPDLAGIRPKLQEENGDFRDFVIKEESELGFPGFINLIGIESPGLTSALAIAKYIEQFIKTSI